MEKLSLKECLLFEEALADRKRRSDLVYHEKFAKKELDRVIVELSGNESGVLTRLASRYDRLAKAIKVMGEKKDELNADIKDRVEALFAAEDIVLTRVIETVSFTMTVSKKAKQDDKIVVDYKGIAEALAKLIPDELQAQVDAIAKAYTTISAQPDKSPGLQVKAKVTEDLLDDIIAYAQLSFPYLKAAVSLMLRKLLKNVAVWVPKFDNKLNALRKMAGIPA